MSVIISLLILYTGYEIANHVDILANPYIKEEKGKGILVAEFLIKNRIDVMIVKKDFESKGPAYVFFDSNVEVLLTEEDVSDLAMKKLGLTY